MLVKPTFFCFPLSRPSRANASHSSPGGVTAHSSGIHSSSALPSPSIVFLAGRLFCAPPLSLRSDDAVLGRRGRRLVAGGGRWLRRGQ